MDEITRLLLTAASGDRAALASFVRRTEADVWRFCAHLVDPTIADDLTQEVYLRVVRAAPRFRGDSAATTWLFRIARRVAADEIRQRQRRRQLPESEPGIQRDASGEVALHDLLRRLDADRRAAFVLTQVVGLSYAEAAGAMGVRIGTIRSRVARARADLIAMLDDPHAGTEHSATETDGTSAPHWR